ncbi:MAG: hypothetical protein Kow00103_05380 [Candidatus Caldatribacteriota bacterium]
MENWVNIFKALAEETRFEIIKLLLKDKLCVRALANHLKITESAISQHLKILHQAGIVKREKCGYYMHYSVNKNKLIEIGGKINQLAQSIPAHSPSIPLNTKEESILHHQQQQEKEIKID